MTREEIKNELIFHGVDNISGKQLDRVAKWPTWLQKFYIWWFT